MADEEAAQQSETNEALAEQFTMDAVNQGLGLKQVRDKENALIQLAEDWLASQAPPPEEDTQSKKAPENKPVLHKK